MKTLARKNFRGSGRPVNLCNVQVEIFAVSPGLGGQFFSYISSYSTIKNQDHLNKTRLDRCDISHFDLENGSLL